MSISQKILSTKLLSASKIPKCFASTGSRGNTRNKPAKTKGLRKGIRCADGDTVHPTYVLATQRLDYKVFPGANVYVDTDMTLRAACKGQVHISHEVYIPHPDTEMGKAVENMPIGSVIFKKCINVIPENKPNSFKLVETI